MGSFLSNSVFSMKKAWWQWRQVNGSSRTLRIGPLVLTRSRANQKNRRGCRRDRANKDYGKHRGPHHNKQAKQHDSPPGAEVRVARTTDSSFGLGGADSGRLGWRARQSQNLMLWSVLLGWKQGRSSDRFHIRRAVDYRNADQEVIG